MESTHPFSVSFAPRFSSRSVQIAAVFSDVLEKALPNLCRSFYTETKVEMFFSVFAVALLAEGVDRNISRADYLRRAVVALLAEGVDRNDCLCKQLMSWQVALLAEGVDRNAVVVGCNQASSSRPPRGGRG